MLHLKCIQLNVTVLCSLSSWTSCFCSHKVFCIRGTIFVIEMYGNQERWFDGSAKCQQQVDLSHSTSCFAFTHSHFDVYSLEVSSSISSDKFMHFYTVHCVVHDLFLYKCLYKWYLSFVCLTSTECVCGAACQVMNSYYMHKCKFSHLSLSFIAIRSIQRPRQ